ncbi:hypothetical protein [Blastococcus litoris]|uniref:hypothetical protein n=1 Tax=Blastococcus litoris TaxID=2171622 RepID=UPI000E3020DA|nr:hypothetical protein [Blastococcus litoris]
MGLLCDYFIAADDEQAALTATWLGGPSASPGALPTADLKGLDPIVPMATLESMLTGGDVEALVAANAGASVAEAQDAVWVHRLSDALTDALAGASPDRLRQVVEPWSRTEELAGWWDPGDLAEALAELADLARRARGGGGALYCWMSL